jgi:hypothetical protein
VCRLSQVAVFGFCDIRRFTDTTEVLQEGVMEFVNVIAHLVHSAVAARGGAANKNIGDAFLLVSWPQQQLMPPATLLGQGPTPFSTHTTMFTYQPRRVFARSSYKPQHLQTQKRTFQSNRI